MTTSNTGSAGRVRRRLIIWGTIIVVAACAGAGFWRWHEQPSFCAAICHNMDPYLATYEQPQNAPGIDKYNNKVSNTNALLCTLHRKNKTTAHPTITCIPCHHAIIGEQVSEATGWMTGNYLTPLNERVGGDLTKWWGKDVDGTTFCVNEACHSYLMKDDGSVNYDRLEASTQNRAFNPHSQHHKGIRMQCTECHKGHRASVLACTGCHQHENVALPKGWVNAKTSKKLMDKEFAAK